MMPDTSDGKLNLRAIIFSILIIICASAFCGCVCAYAGRVVGKIHLHNNSTAELMNNYGWTGMKNNVTGNLFTDNIGRNKINGENLVLTSKTEQTQSIMPIVGLLIGLAAAALLFRRR
ncbi:MAG TPA: LPXTG cell wall anchor domain-containing protein [Methanocorpusculum sp.]|nr:LPXTG cell wall anchor domain-containing protein [Methanocorpusculum sp.]